ncbi:MAG: thioredoxin family protein, partial [Aeoliella sp.]
LLGCGHKADSGGPAALSDVAPRLIERHGQLHFVRDPAAGYKAAAEHGLPCLLFFTAEWCTYCHQMEATAFADGTVRSLAEGFVCILVDADREPNLCRHYGVSGFPTIQFIAADGRILHRLVGRQSAASLATGMRAASKRYAWLTGGSTSVR